ncbi:3878_t:CDS:1, partial [Funneliformis geosporum]
EEQSIFPQSNPNTQVHNIQVHNLPNLINNSRLTKYIKRTTYTEEITLLEPLVNNTNEENINNVIQQLNN